ncbi:MAG TPA: hypothetical protein VIC28_08510 [Thermoanaerobaculia bacterium]
MPTQSMTRPLLFTLLLGGLLTACHPAQEPAAPAPRSWKRPGFQAGGGTPFLLYVVYGSLPEEPKVSRSSYRTLGLPDGIGAEIYGPKVHPEVCTTWLQGPMGELLKTQTPELVKAAAAAPGCMIIQGEPGDARTLDYLRDVVGFLTYLADNGAVAVLDPQTFTLWSPARWRSEFFAPDGPVPHRHVVILTSEDRRPDRLWFHTRGMRKFGRPDLSLRGVAGSQRAAVVDLFNRFIGLQALGGIVPESEEIRMAGLPPGLTCHHRGDVDDPDFNNVHLEIEGRTYSSGDD